MRFENEYERSRKEALKRIRQAEERKREEDRKSAEELRKQMEELKMREEEVCGAAKICNHKNIENPFKYPLLREEMFTN